MTPDDASGPDPSDPLARLRRAGPVVKMLLPGLVVLAGLVVVAPLAWLVAGPFSVVAAAVAAACCGFGAALGTFLGMVVGLAARGPGRAAYEFLAGMLFRMGIPLGAATAIHLAGGPLADAGLLYYLLLFYPVTLAVETALSLPPSNH